MGHSVVRIVSQWALTVDARVRPQTILCGICGRQTGGVTFFFSPRQIAVEGSVKQTSRCVSAQLVYNCSLPTDGQSDGGHRDFNNYMKPHIKSLCYEGNC